MNATGDHGAGSLQGVRSYDFLTDGVRNKMIFFAGYDVELIVYIDEHLPLPDAVRTEIYDIGKYYCPRNFQFVCQPHKRTGKYWNDQIYVNALRLATGDYVAHFDQDCAAFRRPDRLIVFQFACWLSKVECKFICQPTTMAKEDHGMWWASTRFFICKRETLDFDELERCMNENYRVKKYGHCPALEHVLGRMAGENGVLYPAANWDDYLVISWQTYCAGTLRKLNAMPYDAVRDYILSFGILGPNDVAAIRPPE